MHLFFRLAAGTAHGFALFDYLQKKPVMSKCTLNPNGMHGIGLLSNTVFYWLWVNPLCIKKISWETYLKEGIVFNELVINFFSGVWKKFKRVVFKVRERNI